MLAACAAWCRLIIEPARLLTLPSFYRPLLLPLQGYAQHAISCPQCSAMLGWQFTPHDAHRAAAASAAAAGVAPVSAAARQARPPAATDVDPRVAAAQVSRVQLWGGRW